jgi:DNA-binding response OmpR family regulator
METEFDGRPRVAVLEDDADLARLVREILDGAGFETLVVDRLTELEHVARHRPRLLLLDLLLGDTQGRDVLAKLREMGLTDVPVVLLSGKSDLETHMRDLGAVAFVAKPFEIDDLVATCRSATATYA